MSSSGSSIVIFVVFGALAATLVFAMVFMLYDRVIGIVQQMLPRLLPVHDGFRAFKRRLRRDAKDDDEDSDDLDDSTASLISMLNVASIVVDDSDEVIRANPDAYALGVVGDDVIINDRVLDAVHAVRAHGGCRKFALTTSTPERFVPALPEAPGHTRNQRDMQSVSRPNWLKVTVGRLNGRSTVILLDDVSDAIRFSQTRDSFIVNVSEQLLAPTKELERLADALEHEDLDLEQVRVQARQVRRSSRYMSHMVEDLLLLIKAQEPVTPSLANRLSVREQLDWVAERLGDESRRLQVPIIVSCDASVTINGDIEQIRTAVRKLVENALTYSPAKASVSVVAALTGDRKHVVIRVIDRGCGISKAEQPRVFERFFRGANQNDNTAEGIGLGLAIVKHVALTHHGTVSLWSVPGQGSTFSMVLPVAQE